MIEEERLVLDFIEENPGMTAMGISLRLRFRYPEMSIGKVSGYLSSLSRGDLIKRADGRWVPVYEADPEAVWGYEAEVDDRICDRCYDYYTIGEMDESTVLNEFPYLRKVGRYVWRPMVHPNCRCRLIRLEA